MFAPVSRLVPSPSWPVWFLPQHHTEPSADSAHECEYAVAIAVAVRIAIPLHVGLAVRIGIGIADAIAILSSLNIIAGELDR